MGVGGCCGIVGGLVTMSDRCLAIWGRVKKDGSPSMPAPLPPSLFPFSPPVQSTRDYEDALTQYRSVTALDSSPHFPELVAVAYSAIRAENADAASAKVRYAWRCKC